MELSKETTFAQSGIEKHFNIKLYSKLEMDEHLLLDFRVCQKRVIKEAISIR